MLPVPLYTVSRFQILLLRESVPTASHPHYEKWLRYYLAFCHKYGFVHSNNQSLSKFIKKLEEKHQSPEQRGTGRGNGYR